MNKTTSVMCVFCFFLFGCEQDPAWNGGHIQYSSSPSVPKLPPDCDPVADPLEWEPSACAENDYEKRCYWHEQTLSNDEQVMAMCRHEWFFNKWDCEWHHEVSGCESQNDSVGDV